MKKIFFYTFFITFIVCLTNFAFAENEIPGLTDNPEQVNPSTDSMSDNLDAVIKVKEDAHIEAILITNEKAAIEKEKQALEKSAVKINGQKEEFKNEEKVQVIKEKLETVKKKEDAVKAREAILKEKINAYEKITELVERQLRILDNKDIPLKLIDDEIEYAQGTVRKLEKERNTLNKRISPVEREIRSIQKNIEAKQYLLELKGENTAGLAETIKSQKERMSATTDEFNLTKSRIEIIDTQIGIVKDYSKSLQERYANLLKKKLWSPQPYVFHGPEHFLWGLLFLLFLFGMMNGKRLTGIIIRDEAIFFQRLLKRTIQVFLLSGLIFVLLYYLFSFLGYHELLVYSAQKIVWLGAITVFLIILDNMLVKLLRFFCKDLDTDADKVVCHPLTTTLRPVIGWGLLLSGLYFALKIFRVERKGIEVLITLFKYPLFTLKDVPISIWVFFKAGIIFWIFIVFSRVVNNFLHKNIYPRIHLDPSVQYTISVSVKYILFVFGGFAGLRVLGIDLGALAIFAGTIGIGIGLGLQEIAKNFISGLIILFERPIKIGDFIEVGGLPGQVKSIEARSTVVDTFDNISVIVPNGEFMTQRVINWSHSDKIIRVALPVGVAYGSNTRLVRDSLLEVAERHQKVLKRPAPYVWFEEFGDSALNFKLFVWTDDTGNRLQLRSDLNYMIDQIFRERQITIAFPQRDLHIKSSEVVYKIADKDVPPPA